MIRNTDPPLNLLSVTACCSFQTICTLTNKRQTTGIWYCSNLFEITSAHFLLRRPWRKWWAPCTYWKGWPAALRCPWSTSRPPALWATLWSPSACPTAPCSRLPSMRSTRYRSPKRTRSKTCSRRWKHSVLNSCWPSSCWPSRSRLARWAVPPCWSWTSCRRRRRCGTACWLCPASSHSNPWRSCWALWPTFSPTFSGKVLKVGSLLA